MSYLNVQFGKFAADSVADRGRRRVVIKVSRNGAAISWSNRIAAAADLAFDVRCLRLRCLQSCLSQNRPAALGGIFLPIDRRDMRRVSIELWPAGIGMAAGRGECANTGLRVQQCEQR